VLWMCVGTKEGLVPMRTHLGGVQEKWAFDWFGRSLGFF